MSITADRRLRGAARILRAAVDRIDPPAPVPTLQERVDTAFTTALQGVLTAAEVLLELRDLTDDLASTADAGRRADRIVHAAALLAAVPTITPPLAFTIRILERLTHDDAISLEDALHMHRSIDVDLVLDTGISHDVERGPIGAAR